MSTYAVTGLTCEHCAAAVRAEVGALPGVSSVSVELVPGGVSRVTVDGAVERPALEAALAEAGDYVLAEP